MDAFTFEAEYYVQMSEFPVEAQCPIVVLLQEVFSGMFSTIGRMEALGSCLDLKTGKYRNAAMTQYFGSENTDLCMRIAHKLLWNGWILGSLEQQRGDILSYTHDVSTSMEHVLSLWIEKMHYAFLIPISATLQQRALFDRNLGLIFKLPRGQCSFRPMANVTERRTSCTAALDQVVCTLRERYFDPTLSVKALSHGLNLSERHLGRLFTETLGQTFRRYLRDIRISEAAHLLANTTQEVKMIAGKVGYSHSSHFGEDFRASMGCTPLAFRREATDKRHVLEATV